MLDIKFIRENLDLVKSALAKRKSSFDLEGLLALDEKRRTLIKEIEYLRAEQNKLNDSVSSLLKEKKNAQSAIEESKKISHNVKVLEEEFKNVKKEFDAQLLYIPNIPYSSIPIGDASANRIIKTEGKIREFNFKLFTHIDLAAHLDIIDFRAASKISGSNFILFKGDGARLERALINFMLDLHTKENGYKEICPPLLVNRASMTATGQLPKLEEDMYKTSGDDYFLIPTAEVPVTNIHRDEIIEEDKLPIYYTAYTPCFRREAGSYGKDTRGLARVHQFDKVELVKFVKPQTSYEEWDKLLKDAVKVLELLGLSYRIILLSTQEISFAAAACYDIEIYAPGIDKWLEVSSCSNFEDFQARRGNIRYRDKEGIKFVHTLNGSGVALARLVLAILENYQNSDGSVTIPEVLRKYFDGQERIT